MKYYLLGGLIVSFIVISYFTHRDRTKELYIKNPDLCHDIDDLILDT